MKKVYERPVMVCDKFVANEYVAACWRVGCNVKSGIGYYEKNGVEGYQALPYYDLSQEKWISADDYIANGTGCGTWHGAVTNEAPVANAKWQDADGTVHDVFYFNKKGEGSSSHHFCLIDSAQWYENPKSS